MAYEIKKCQNMKRWKITKIILDILHHYIILLITIYQHFKDRLNAWIFLPATQIDEESEKNPYEIWTYTSEDLEDKLSINGKKSTKKCTRESWSYLETLELISLWKENLSILESSRCIEGWHFMQK